MRIALWHNLPSGGGKRTVYNHLQGLVKRGHTVEVWCPPTADRDYCPLSELVEEHVIPLSWPPKSALISRLKRLYGAIVAMDRHCLRCAEQINTGRFDVLIAHPCMFLAVSSIARHVNI